MSYGNSYYSGYIAPPVILSPSTYFLDYAKAFEDQKQTFSDLQFAIPSGIVKF